MDELNMSNNPVQQSSSVIQPQSTMETMLTLYHVSFERRVAFLLTHFVYGWIFNTQLYINNCNFL